MALVFYDRVRETTTVTGTNDATLLGAVTGFQAFSVVGNGNTCYYTIADQAGGNWEVGIGTYSTTGPTLQRTTILSSSNSNNKVAFGAGTKDVFLTYPSSKAVYLDASNNAQPNLGNAAATQLNITGQGDLRLEDTTGGEYVALQAPGTLASSYTLTLPVDDGTNGQALITDGNGNLSWSTAASGDVYGPASATDNAITRFDGTTGKLIQNSSALVDDAGNVLAGAGLVGAPAFSTTGDTNTGIFFPAADTIAFTEGGVEAMRINSSGRVSIGTTTATTELNVYGTNNTAASSSTFWTPNFTGIVVNNNSNTTNTVSGISFQGGSASTSISGIGNILESTTLGALAFFTGGSGRSNTVPERMRIDSSGNVGIGTNNPQTLLDLNGGTSNYSLRLNNGDNTKSTSIIFATGNTARQEIIKPSSTSNLQFRSYATGAAAVGFEFYVSNGSVESQAMIINSSGNVGIGTSSPVGKFDVSWGGYTTNPTMLIGADIGNNSSRTNNTRKSATILNPHYTNTEENVCFAFLDSDGTNNEIYLGGGDSSWNAATAIYFYTGATTTTTSGTERMRIDSSGRVGIGTNSPSYRLDSVGNVNDEISIRTYNSNGSSLATARLYAQSDISTAQLTSYSSTFGFNLFGTSAASYSSLITSGNGSAGLMIGTQVASPIIIGTNATERMRIDSSGNVGIGTTSPGYKLVVAGQSTDANNILTGTNILVDTQFSLRQKGNNAGISGTTYAAQMYSGPSGGALEVYTVASTPLVLGTAATERMRITSGGDVGIGTTSPKSVGNYRFVTTNATTGSGYSVQVNGTESSNFYANTGATVVQEVRALPLVFETNATERMRIDSSGNVGIGTTSPSFAVDVVRSSGDAQLRLMSQATGTNGIIFRNNAAPTSGKGAILYPNGSSASGADTMQFVVDNAERMRITSGGEVYIAGTTDQGAYNLQVNGTGVWGAGAYVNGSDERIKDNIAPLDSGLDVVSKLNPVTYKYKEDWSKDQSTQTGFIAQELLTALDGKNYVDGVVQQGGEYMSVAYQNIIPILTKAIQEQQAMIEELKQEVAKLKGA